MTVEMSAVTRECDFVHALVLRLAATRRRHDSVGARWLSEVDSFKPHCLAFIAVATCQI